MAGTEEKTAKKNGQQGILIKCHGMYYYKTESAKGTKPFVMDVRAPSLEYFREHAFKYQGTGEKGEKKFADRSFINIRGQLKKRLLPILLQRKVTDFARVKYVVIDEVVSETKENLDLPITLRSRQQLAQLIKENKMPIDVNEYMDVDELRSDIIEYQVDPETFNKDKPRRDKRRSEEKQFIEMNNLEETLPPEKRNSGGKAGGIDDL
ncbi:MAG: hypothetical protein WC476_12105 [Phycisphaerae bacterium]|jgi:hypothetical protein